MFRYGIYIVRTLNKCLEKFEAQTSWDLLGKPQITLKNFDESL